MLPAVKVRLKFRNVYTAAGFNIHLIPNILNVIFH